MAENRRRDVATATVGLAGTGGAGALRHAGLERAYSGGKRPPLAQELKLLRRGTKGRGHYLAGAGLGLLSVPPAAVGTARLVGGKRVEKRERKTLLEEGIGGVKDSLKERVDTVSNPAPAKLVAANYLGGAAIGSAAGGLVHRGLGRSRLHGGARSALASAAGVAAGAATLPLQSKAIERATHGKYVATPTGVRRKKTPARRPSRSATVVDGRAGRSHLPPGAIREQMGPVGKARRPPYKPRPKKLAAPQPTLFDTAPEADTLGMQRAMTRDAKARAKAAEMRRIAFGSAYPRTPAERARWRELGGDVEKMSPRAALRTATKPARAVGRAYNTVGAHAGAHWTVNGLRAADKIDVPDRRVLPSTKKGKLLYTGRTKAANAVRSAAFEVASLNDKDAMARNTIHGHPLFGKRDSYYGESMSPGAKRARVMAAGVAPVVGDFAAAGAAASMAPPELRRKTAALQFGGSQGGQLVGTTAGAYGLVRAARHPKVKAKVERANDAIDAGTNAVRTRLGMKAKTGPGALMRVAESSKTPKVVRGALRPLAKNPKVAALGALAGGMTGTQAGGYAGYGRALSLERERNARLKGANTSARRGVGKRAADLTPDEHRRQARKKKLAAGVATFTGLTGTSALAALGGSKVARARGAVRTAERFERAQTPLLTAGAGVGGLGSFNFASIQRKEAKAEQKAAVGKAIGIPRVSVPRIGPRRAPTMRRGFVRQTRYPSGIIRSTTVRGGVA